MLNITSASVQFDSYRVLDDLSLQVEPNTTLGLIGPNGSGKTTLLNAITGVVPLLSGEIWWQGTILSNKPPAWIARQGVARTFQNLRFFPLLSVLDNVRAAQLVFRPKNSPKQPSAQSHQRPK